MKKFVLALLTVCAVAVLFSCGGKKSGDSLEALKSRGEFVLGLDDSFPPMGYRNADNEIVGFDIDLAKEVAKRLGVKFRAQPIDWDSKEKELNTGNIDCIWNGLTITEERQKVLCFSKPYLSNEQVVVVRNDSSFKSLSDLKGKSIALQQGSSAEDAVNDNPDFKNSVKEIVPLEQNLIALNDLVMKGVDGVVMDSIVAEYAISHSGFPLHVLEQALAEEKYGIAFRKTDDKLRDEVQKILEEMAADGTVDRISTEWFGSNITSIGR